MHKIKTDIEVKTNKEINNYKKKIIYTKRKVHNTHIRGQSRTQGTHKVEHIYLKTLKLFIT